MKSRHAIKGWPLAVALAIGSGVLIIVACMVGAVPISVHNFVSVLFGFGEGDALPRATQTILFDVRMPRVLLSFVVGGSLSVCGACMQGIFKNPLADPYILGVSSGAGFGATLCIGLGTGAVGWLGITGSAFLGGLVSIAMVLGLSATRTRVFTTSLLLSGVALSALFSALTSVVMIVERNKMEHIVLWAMGSFSAAAWDGLFVVVPIMLVGCLICLFFARDLNVMLLGDEQARNLGVEISRVRWVLLVNTALIASAAVSVCGIIGFVGLIVPHILRMGIGPGHRMLIINSFLGGGVLLVLSDMLARTMVAPVEMPVGVITAICGVPFFLFMLRRRAKKGELL